MFCGINSGQQGGCGLIIKYKLSDFAKDMAVQNKQVVELLSGKFGDAKKHTTPLSEPELDFLLEHFTRGTELASLDEYLASAPPPQKRAQNEKPQPKKPEAAQKPAANAAINPPIKPAPQAFAGRVQTPQQGQKAPQPDAKPGVPKQQPPKKRDGLGRIRLRDDKPEKESANAPKREVITRTIDTRATDVNLDKFNEKYTALAGAREGAPSKDRRKTTFGKQKIKQNRGRQTQYANKKRETESERLQRIQLEKARSAQLKVAIPDEITVGELASRLKAPAPQIIKRLMALGVMASLSDMVDFDTASIVAEEMNAKVTREVRVTIEERLFKVEEDEPKNMETRPPVVVVMGHVDHGKTSILDAIRQASVTKGEAGGITQHIGAYQVEKNGKKITFLDTPGHEAFTSMRARGANLTDIAVLVVAADDGIMPQTIESISHAKAAGVSIIVAINKMDKETANPEKIKQQLTEYELVPEEWGGDVVMVLASAATGQGIDELLEMIALSSDVMELKANPERRAKGAVVEARLDKGQGPIATILVQNGTLAKGDVIIAGTTVGRVRTMRDADGNALEFAGPSTPVEITGLTEVPAAGDLFDAVEDERLARELADRRQTAQKEEEFGKYTKVTLDNLFSQIEAGTKKELPIIVKADVQGSSEAIKQSLEKLSSDEVRVKVIHGGVGAINKSDVMLASAAGAIVIGFNVRPDPVAKADAAQADVEMRMYRVIYDAIDDVQAAMRGLLAPKIREVEQGRIEVRQVIKVSSVGTIAGCYVLEGKVTRGSQIRLVRDGIVITEDEISSLRRFKDDVKEVAQSYECGIGLEKYNDIKEGDIFEAFILEEYRD